MSHNESKQYDAFISYRHEEPDKELARDLFRKLENVGYKKVAIDERDFDAAESFLEEMERCVKTSRYTLAVVSHRYFKSGNAMEEAIITKVLDMDERSRRLIPVKYETTDMPPTVPCSFVASLVPARVS